MIRFGLCFFLTLSATALGQSSARVQSIVPVSEEAARGLASMKDAAARSAWEIAVREAERILDGPGGRMISGPSTRPGAIVRDARWLVGREIAKWGADGLAELHRRRVAPAELPDDDGGLRTLYLAYPCTERAREAALAKIDRDMEAGRFSAVAWTVEECLYQFSRPEERARLLFCAGMAAWAEGHSDLARQWLDRLTDESPDATNGLVDRPVKLADHLALTLRGPCPGAESAPWRGLGGDERRRAWSEIPAFTRLEAAWTANLSPIGEFPARSKSWIDTQRQNGRTLAASAATDGGGIFINRGFELIALQASDGKPLKGWIDKAPGATVPWPGKDGRRWVERLVYESGAPQFSTSVGPGCVVGAAGAYYMFAGDAAQPPKTHSRLLCVDRTTGSVLWDITPADLPHFLQPGFWFAGAAVQTDDLAIMQLRRPFMFHLSECHVVGVRLSSGKAVWSAYVGAGTSSSEGFANTQDEETMASQPAFSDGRVFVATSLGSIAAVDAATGDTVWIAPYDAVAPGKPSANPARAPARQNPVIVDRGVLWSMPYDGNALLALDAGNGQELARVPRDRLSGASALIGVRDGVLFVCSNETVAAVRRPVPGAPKDHRDPILWRATTPSIRGRGLIAGKTLVLPTIGGLVGIDTESGAVTKMVPTAPPGHLLLAGQRLVLVGETTVMAWDPKP